MLIRVLNEALSALRANRGAGGRKGYPSTENAGEGNPLERWFAGHSGRLTQKWHHYLGIYHRHFQRYRGRSPLILEIGVSQGGSFEMWREYFGAGCRLFGIDIDPRCKVFEDETTTILIGDQSSRSFLEEVRNTIPRVDILIDDGGHMMSQQIATFEELYQHVLDDGIYLCEDLHTSYLPEWGGGYGNPNTFIEYSKKLVDRLNAWYCPGAGGLQVDDFTRSTYALHYYDSVLVIEKRPVGPPRPIKAGRTSF